MKKTFLWTIALAFVVLLIVFLRPASDTDASSVTGNAVANTFALETIRTEVERGDTVVVNLVARDVRDVFGVQLSVRYDPGVLEFVSADEGPFLSRSGVDETLYLSSVLSRAEPGLVKDFVLVKLGEEGTSGSGVVGTLTFQAIGAGETELSIVDALVADKDADTIPVNYDGIALVVR